MEIYRQLPCEADFTMGQDPAGRDHLSLVVKRTFDFPDAAGGSPVPSKTQAPLVHADQYHGAPGFSACRWETDFAFRKARCDVIVNGAAHAPRGEVATKLLVGIRLGQWSKSFDVFGERHWLAVGPAFVATDPVPFRRQPISYDHAFGGTDRLDPDDPEPGAYDPNPVGTGWAARRNHLRVNGMRLPHTQASDEGVSSPFGTYTPMALGPYGRGWPQRRRYAGTYDQAWQDNVFPFLPGDFDERYYQSAPPDQQVPPPRTGTEVVLLNLTDRGREFFRLIDCELPLSIFRGAQPALDREVLPDTVLFDTDARKFALVWRVDLPMRRGFLEFSEAWVGPPTEAMVRAKREGRRYVRAVASGGGGEGPE